MYTKNSLFTAVWMLIAKVEMANIEQSSLVKYITVYSKMEYYVAFKKNKADLFALIQIKRSKHNEVQ